MNFYDNSTAGGAHIINLSASHSTFWDNSSAGSATISVYDASSLGFSGSSTAGTATIGSLGDVVFSESSSAGSAFISNGAVLGFPGGIYFNNSSQGGTNRTNQHSRDKCQMKLRIKECQNNPGRRHKCRRQVDKKYYQSHENVYRIKQHISIINIKII